MTLDVEVPEPPSLSGRESPAEDESDARRAEIEGFLEDGAWRQGFEEWAENTALSTPTFQRVVRAGLVDQFDFFWDPTTTAVEFRAPTVPDDLREQFEDADDVEEELHTLGHNIAERVGTDYVLREEDVDASER